MAQNCPRCAGVKLEEIELGEILVDRCRRCAGLWFDGEEIGELVGRRKGILHMESTVPAREREQPGMACPRCEDVMLRESTVCASGRFLYRCASCAGTWLDRGELRDWEDGGIVAGLAAYFEKFCGDE